nr:MAG TPA: hypothetical protein [Bacteriophage sp.]
MTLSSIRCRLSKGYLINTSGRADFLFALFFYVILQTDRNTMFYSFIVRTI